MIYNPEWIDLNFLSMAEADGVLFGGGNHGIWESKDDGVTWTRVITGDDYLDSSPSKYEVVSIVALSENHFFFSVIINKEALFKGFRVVRHGFYEYRDGKLKFCELPEGASEYVMTMIAYDQDFNGRDLMFVSSSESGLYAYDFSTNSWEKLLNKRTTRVSVDYENDHVYVSTTGDWYYRGRYENGKWNWEHITIPWRTCPVAGFIVRDPYNPERLWFGTETGIRGSLYRTGSKERNVPTFVGVGFWRDGKWYDLRLNPRWAPTIAIVKHKEGESRDNYIIETKYGIGARMAFVPRAGKGNIQRTMDGGSTWERSYNGIYADTINKIAFIESGLRKGDIVVTCVSGTQITSDFGDSWEEGIDFTIGDIGYGLPGYAWGAASPSEKLEGRYGLLIATGYPPSDFTGNGVYTVDTEGPKTGSRERPLKRIVEGSCYDLVIIDNVLYVDRMDSGVDVVDLKTYDVKKLKGIPDDEAGINIKYYDGILVVSTIKGGNKNTDHYFFSDTRALGGVYVFVNDTCNLVYKGKRAVSVSLHGDELVILTVKGKGLHFTNLIKDWELQLPEAVYSDMAIDWKNRVVFFSTFDTSNPGVLYGDLDDLEAGLRPLEEILTRRVGCLLLVGNHLFAGTEGRSVWRFDITRVHRVVSYALTLSLSKNIVKVGETIMLSGGIEPPTEGLVKILLSIDGEYKEVGSVPLSEGKYAFQYTPRKPGIYRFKVVCYDQFSNLIAESEEKSLRVLRSPVKERIKISVDKMEVKIGEEVRISGTISPLLPRIEVIIVVSGPEGGSAHSIIALKGKFSFTLKPSDKGTWSVYAEIEGNKKIASPKSNVITLKVIEEKKCVIATVIFGSELSPEVTFLRSFRDNFILATFAGRSFYVVFDRFYYSWSPYIVSVISDLEPAKIIVKALIYPLIRALRLTAMISLSSALTLNWPLCSRASSPLSS